MPDPRDEEGISLLEILKKATNRKSSERVHIVYFKESAAYGVIFTSCLSQNPNEWGASTFTFYFPPELFITLITRIFTEIDFFYVLRANHK